MNSLCRMLLLTSLLISCVCVAADNDDTHFRWFQSVIDNKEIPLGDRMKQVGEYLRKLNKEEFLNVIRGTRKMPGYTETFVDGGMLMFMADLVDIYLDGPGKNEPLLVTLKQLSDVSLPGAWRLSLLEVTRADKDRKLSREEKKAVWRSLINASINTDNTEQFRLLCLDRLGRYLCTQRYHMVKRSHFLASTLLPRDRDTLNHALRANASDPDTQSAIDWLDMVDEYEALAQKTIKEMKDDQHKAHFKKMLVELASKQLPQ